MCIISGSSSLKWRVVLPINIFWVVAVNEPVSTAWLIDRLLYMSLPLRNAAVITIYIYICSRAEGKVNANPNTTRGVISSVW